MSQDYDQYLHREWLGLLQPEGLVVSPPALVDAQAFVDKSKAIALQPVLQAIAQQELINGKAQTWVPEFVTFAGQILEWATGDYAVQTALPEALSVNLPDYGETLLPDYAVADPDSDGWLLLVQCVPLGEDLDSADEAAEKGWKATYQQKFERLLKGTQVPIGVLWNGTHLRLVYAPSGESSGHVTFPIEAMTEGPGRTILGALEMLLGAERLFNSPTDKTLPKLLEASRNYQATVSNKLAEQVLDALWELLRGFQAADAQRYDKERENEGSLQALAKEDPQHIYGGLLTTLMRLVFLLYAEDRGLMPDDSVYQGNYSVSGLYEKLRADAALYPDTMDQRYGAWAWLLSLFRLVYDGGGAYEAYLPARHGQLFDPREYKFLEGIEGEIPRIADGVIYRILKNLFILDGERLSYRTLDVENIGSVYEIITGYELEIAYERSIAIRPKDVVIGLDALLAAKPKDRAKLLKEQGDLTLPTKAAAAIKEADTIEEILAALERRVSSRTQQVLMPGSLYLQPGEERRRTGSHYTPRKLTQPMVETTLQPVLAQLGPNPTAEKLLDLKVCDLAMGSAAFLVEACRQLAEQVVEAWAFHGSPADLPDTIEPELYARRLVAQRCLYGVDKNPFAVNLAKQSLWLVTLARDLPFTFVDHALKCGDSLVGVREPQLNKFMAASDLSDSSFMDELAENSKKAKFYQDLIAFKDATSDESVREKQGYLEKAELESSEERILSDVVVAAFFSSNRSHSDDLSDEKLMSDIALAAFFTTLSKSKREAKKINKELATKVNLWRTGVIDRSELEVIARIPRSFKKPIFPFHWKTEFQTVFNRDNPGFDVIVGNPPFAGKNTLINANSEGYLQWLKEIHPESHGNSDLVAHFFRRAFDLLRQDGSLGLIATNTIAQGDTRSTGLRFICNNGGVIYNATRRYKWPGLAAVVVSLVHIWKPKA